MSENVGGRSPSSVVPANGNGKGTGNLIMQNAGRKELGRITPFLESVRLRANQILHERGETIHSVYFLTEGFGSVLTTQPDGSVAEVGLIGREGFVGMPVIFGFKTTALRVVTHSDGMAYRMNAKDLLNVLPECPKLLSEMQRFTMIFAMQTAQLSACNLLHNVVQRLSRRLLMTLDRLHDDKLMLTQEFLGQMLGSRRASVTVAAGILQKEGVIEYSRGVLKILDRKKLSGAACACYSLIELLRKKWEAELQRHHRN